MIQARLLNGREAHIIDYFELTSTKEFYIIYHYPTEPNVIYIGQVIKKGNTYNIQLFDKQTTFIIKELIKDLTQNQIGTVKSYKYLSRKLELPKTLEVIASQKIVLTEETFNNVKTCINYIEEHNQEILEQAKDEYYLKLLDEKTKERRTIIALITVLVLALSGIAAMIANFYM